MKLKVLLPFVLLFTIATCSDKPKLAKSATNGPPEQLYGQLFYDVQGLEIFSDSKTFVDCVPARDLDSILSEYKLISNKSPEAVSKFVKKNFIVPVYERSLVTDSSGLSGHIADLYKTLKHLADKKIAGTLIALPYPYLSAGGQVGEMQYFDSYFTILGLQADGDTEGIQNTVDNFSWLINQYGFVPAGNRTYYLSRSQAPVFALMLSVLAQAKGDSIYKKYLPALEKEYAFWMRGSEQLNSTTVNAFQRVVRLPGGEVLNRYWDEQTTPRSEKYREDLKAAKEASLVLQRYTEKDIYRNIRAAAESGWEGSSRWLDIAGDKMYNPATIHTTDYIPVDLNCLLYYEELVLARAYSLSNTRNKAMEFNSRAEERMNAINAYCWSGQKNYYMDFDFIKKRHSLVFTLAGAFPLFFQIASPEQAIEVESRLNSVFLREGGLVTTIYNTGQNWDAPYAYAPLQWIAIRGLRNYNLNNSAEMIKDRWLKTCSKAFKLNHQVSGKLNVEDLSEEKTLSEKLSQDHLGWTIGVYQKLLKENK